MFVWKNLSLSLISEGELLLGKVFLFDRLVFPFDHFEHIIPLSPGLQGFCWEICWIPFYVMAPFSLAAFKILPLVLKSLIIMHLSEDTLGSKLFGHIWASYPWTAILPRFGMCSATVSLNNFSIPFSSSLSGISIMRMLLCFMVSHNSHEFSSCLFFLFLFLLWLEIIQRFVFKFTASLFCMIEPNVEALYCIFL